MYSYKVQYFDELITESHPSESGKLQEELTV